MQGMFVVGVFLDAAQKRRRDGTPIGNICTVALRVPGGMFEGEFWAATADSATGVVTRSDLGERLLDHPEFTLGDVLRLRVEHRVNGQYSNWVVHSVDLVEGSDGSSEILPAPYAVG